MNHPNKFDTFHEGFGCCVYSDIPQIIMSFARAPVLYSRWRRLLRVGLVHTTQYVARATTATAQPPVRR